MSPPSSPPARPHLQSICNLQSAIWLPVPDTSPDRKQTIPSARAFRQLPPLALKVSQRWLQERGVSSSCPCHSFSFGPHTPHHHTHHTRLPPLLQTPPTRVKVRSLACPEFPISHILTKKNALFSSLLSPSTVPLQPFISLESSMSLPGGRSRQSTLVNCLDSSPGGSFQWLRSL